VIGVRDLSVSLGGRDVLRGVSLAVAPGEFVAICGPNGAGKTTLLKALAGLLPGGVARPREVAYVPQGARCAWGLTVRQVAALGRIPHGDGNDAAVEAALAACGVAALAERRVDRISGGQARRAMLARAWASEPRALLLDEPVADLDPAAAHDVMALMAGFARAGGAVVAVLHALELAAHYAGRMVVLRDGAMVADGAPDVALAAAAEAFDMDLHARAPLLLRPRFKAKVA
jgi:iron complex transport system ATP-binding protein